MTELKPFDKLSQSATTSWGYEDGPWKGPGPPLLEAADLIHKPPASIEFAPIKHALAVTVEPFKFSPAEPVAYELSYQTFLNLSVKLKSALQGITICAITAGGIFGETGSKASLSIKGKH